MIAFRLELLTVLAFAWNAANQPDVGLVKDIETLQAEFRPAVLDYIVKKNRYETNESSIDPTRRRARLKAELSAADEKQRKLGEKILANVLAAYRLTPGNPSATIQAGPFKGDTVQWPPEYGNEETRTAKGITMSTDAEAYGVYWHDGKITLSAWAFHKSPGFAAATVVHEIVHMEQWTSKTQAAAGVIIKETGAHGEALAYARSLQLASSEIISMERAHDEHIRSIQKRMVKNVSQMPVIHVERPAPVAQLRDGGLPPMDPDVMKPPPEPFDAVEKLASLAAKACAGTLNEDDLKLSWFPTGAHIWTQDGMKERLEGCEREKFELILEMNQRREGLDLSVLQPPIIHYTDYTEDEKPGQKCEPDDNVGTRCTD